ncbi:putative protein kinase RLK-Pelle-CR4L family [Helianthus annuus]|nr:putative protein kinase RLK-Pelle-CR4L family [Helianthus annuus]
MASEASTEKVSKNSGAASTSKRPLRVFEISEILTATRNFHQSLEVGKGGNATVYKGTLPNGTLVAVKRLDTTRQDAADGFRSEIAAGEDVKPHENVLELIGYCDHEEGTPTPIPTPTRKPKPKLKVKWLSQLWRRPAPPPPPPTTTTWKGTEMVLIYPFMAKGTLSQLLHVFRSPVSFLERLKLCISIARGIHHLHYDGEMVHRDIKSSNILLDENGVVKIADFGLAKNLSGGSPVRSATPYPQGTPGYMDLAYFYDNQLTRAIDVYSFGAVCLEILCRNRVIFEVSEQGQKSQQNLVQSVEEKAKKGSLLAMVDPEIRNELSRKFIKKFYDIVESCFRRPQQPEMGKRPQMSDVLTQLLTLRSQFENQLELPKTSHAEISVVDIASSSQGGGSGFKQYTFNELEKATIQFRDELHVFELPNVRVFQGWVDPYTFLPSNFVYGIPIAVKQLNQPKGGIVKPDEDELESYRFSTHPNVIKTLGWCTYNDSRFIVYEYLRKSLAQSIHEDFAVVPWSIRLQIIKGIANGLEYLHSQKNLYSHFTSYGVYLDKELNAKIASFGWASEEKKELIMICGTVGFTDAGYAPHDNEPKDNDIRCFGQVLLETLIRGSISHEKKIVKRLKGLVDASAKKQDKKLKKLMDPSIGIYPQKDVVACLRLGMRCLEKSEEMRPSRAEIVDILRDIQV